ncbi:hypothetical protein PInf_019934 [Phytophthora infestans]|nr:hypothetical protein PInf_019934 [Phytophthora infestans]
MSSSLLRARRLGHRLAATRRGFHAGAVTAFPEVPFKLADIGEGIAEVEVLQWFVKSGDEVKQFQNVCEVQSDKATVEITSRYDGVVTKVHYEVGEMAKVGSTLIDIDVDEATAAATSGGGKKKGAPIPRRAPHPIDLHDVEGTGPQGRILKGDLLEYIRMLATQPSTSSVSQSTTATPPPVVDGSNATYLQQDTVVPLTPIQKMMVKSMNAALQIPHFGYADEIRMDALYDLRKS